MIKIYKLRDFFNKVQPKKLLSYTIIDNINLTINKASCKRLSTIIFNFRRKKLQKQLNGILLNCLLQNKIHLLSAKNFIYLNWTVFAKKKLHVFERTSFTFLWITLECSFLCTRQIFFHCNSIYSIHFFRNRP